MVSIGGPSWVKLKLLCIFSITATDIAFHLASIEEVEVLGSALYNGVMFDGKKTWLAGDWDAKGCSQHVALFTVIICTGCYIFALDRRCFKKRDLMCE